MVVVEGMTWGRGEARKRRGEEKRIQLGRDKRGKDLDPGGVLRTEVDSPHVGLKALELVSGVVNLLEVVATEDDHRL